jgi:hypothetical protein
MCDEALPEPFRTGCTTFVLAIHKERELAKDGKPNVVRSKD